MEPNLKLITVVQIRGRHSLKEGGGKTTVLQYQKAMLDDRIHIQHSCSFLQFESLLVGQQAKH